MTGLEETFRAVLAARLPDDPKWAAWIDGAAQELAAADARRRTVERDTIRDQERRINAARDLCEQEAERCGYVRTEALRAVLGEDA